MPILNTQYPTLANVVARMGNAGKIHQNTVEILSQSLPELEDMVFVEANGFTEHITSVRAGMPDVIWRRLYKGTPNSRSEVVQVKDSMGQLSARSAIDEDLLKLNGNKMDWLASEQIPFIEAMGQAMIQALWYEDGVVHPERFMGFSPRFSDKSAANGKNIIDAGGTGNNNTSIWLVVWGQNTVHCIYPKGSTAGLVRTDMGIRTINDSEGNPFEVHETKYSWYNGLVVRDWRYVVRIANIDVAQLSKDMKTGANLPSLMADALEMVPNLNGKPAFYMNRDVRKVLRGQIERSAGYTITQEQVGGKQVTRFGDGDGVPVRLTDSLLSTEQRVK